jgi:DNA-binding CsgD family transcriptional regulator
MSPLRTNDIRAALDVATLTLQVRDQAQLQPTLLAGLATLVGSDTAALTHLDLRTQWEKAVFWPRSRADPERVAAYARVSHTHPLRRPLLDLAAARPSRITPLRLSDVLTTRAWQSTAIYREAMRGTTDQVCLPLCFRGATVRAVTLSRVGGRFTDRQRDLLALTGAHVNAALARARLRDAAPGQQIAPVLAAPVLAAAVLSAPVLAAPVGPASPMLSPREREVLDLVAEGLTDAQIARRLELRPATVSKHLHRIYRRLDLPNRAAAARLWTAVRDS